MAMHSIPVFDADGHVIEDVEAIYKHYEGKFEKTILNRAFGLFPSLDGWPRGASKEDGESSLSSAATTIEMWDDMLGKMGLAGSVLYPTMGLASGMLKNTEWATATATAYNNWVEEHFIKTSKNLYAAGLMAVQDPAGAVTELVRCAKQRERFPAMMLPSVTCTGKHFGDEFFWPIYEAAEKHNMPLAFHGGPSTGFGFDNFDSFIKTHTLEHPFPLMVEMTDIIFSGVYDAFPNLRIAYLEGGCSWIPFMMDRLDYEYDSVFGEATRNKLKKRPSDYFREGENIWVAFELGENSLKYVIDAMGPDRILYASDFPHEPTEEDLINELPEFIASDSYSDEIKRKVLHDNNLAFYHLN